VMLQHGLGTRRTSLTASCSQTFSSKVHKISALMG
jgi:hypothetical protein